MSFELSALPYAYDALEPTLSKMTLKYHHDAHHRGYVDKLNKLIVGTSLEDMTLVEIIETTASNETQKEIFNNAAQVWNHAFFWNSMTPRGGGDPTGPLAVAINNAFGSITNFREVFVKAAVGHFGSGWAWLVVDNCHLRVTTTPNAKPPLIKGQHALLTCDLWEHAYYLDYQNRRKAFVEAYLATLVNWQFASKNFTRAEVGEAA